MSQQQHTPEPWQASENLVFSIAKDCIKVLDEVENEATARRIVACVNLCAGIDPVVMASWELQGMTIKQMLDEHQQSVIELTEHLDELLSALERLSFAAMCRDNTMGDQCRLIEVKAELAAANRQAQVAIASVKETK